MKLPGAEFSPAARAFAWGGAIAFVISLGYFLYSYDVRFVRTVHSSDLATALTWNATLFSVFALHHSVFARDTMRLMVRRIFADLERSFYVWVASLLFIATCALWRGTAGMVWEVRGLAAWVLWGVHVTAAWLCVRSAVVIDVWNLSGVKPPLPPRPLPPGPLPSSPFKTDGPYGWVRHPIYLGWFVLVFSTPTMTLTQFMFASVSCAYVLIAIPFEERTLIRSSGGAYEEYMRRVPRKLVPFLY